MKPVVRKWWPAGGAGGRLVEAKVEVVLRSGGREDEGQVEGVDDDGREEPWPLAQVGDSRCLRRTRREREDKDNWWMGGERAKLDPLRVDARCWQLGRHSGGQIKGQRASELRQETTDGARNEARTVRWMTLGGCQSLTAA